MTFSALLNAAFLLLHVDPVQSSVHTDSFANFNLRLKNGSTRHDGFVETYFGHWIPICYSSTANVNAARVICKTLGYKPE